MITEWYVLNELADKGWKTVEELSPSDIWDDLWTVSRIIETLESEKLVEHTRSKENVYSYHITQSGRYRLQQLKERREYELKTSYLLNELNTKAEQERLDRIADSEKVARAAAEQKRVENIRFWISFITTLIGSVAAVGGLIVSIVSR